MIPSSGTIREYTSDALIVATGASARWLGSEGPYRGNGVSTCATCDGHFYRGKEIAVVGGGDSAVEEATFLTKFATKVTLIHRRDTLRASKIMQDRVAKQPQGRVCVELGRRGSLGEKQDGHQVLTGVKLKSTTDNSTRDLKIDGLFLAIGHVPNTAHFPGPARHDARRLSAQPHGAWRGRGSRPRPGLLDSLPNYGTATNVEGVFACGDVVDTHYRQAITAAGSGCAAAMDCEKWLETSHSGLIALMTPPERLVSA